MNYILPGHGIGKRHVCWSLSDPSHLSPPNNGLGLSHFLVLILAPSPQVIGHELQDDHKDHPPCSKTMQFYIQYTYINNAFF